MITAEEWLTAIAKSLNEVADSYLDVSDAPRAEYEDLSNIPKAGAVMRLVSGSNSVEIQFLSTEEGAQSLARGLLGFEFDEPIATEDMSDAIAEIMNMVGGLTKRELHEKDPGLKMSLPMFMNDQLKRHRDRIKVNAVNSGFKANAVNSRFLELGPVVAKIVTVNEHCEGRVR